ncbi:PTS system mannose/fructose/sorbose family transporter subunit IID [bacterium]|nr:PTS system mannose/fructose/sorbose family transporter subunit IID [bacterium]
MDNVSRSTKRLNFLTLLNIYLRSFFFQGSFSIKDRQNMGFAFCLDPAGRILCKDQLHHNAFRFRHSEHFNCNPFMVTLLLGAVANMEERLLLGDGVTVEDISRFKQSVGQATGAVGDRFFWRTLRPFGLLMGLLAVMYFGLWGIPVFLAVFNIPTVLLKWHWLTTGYRLGPKAVIEITNHRLDHVSKIMANIGGVVLAFLAVVFLTWDDYRLSFLSVGTLIIFSVSMLLFKRKISHSVVFPLAAFLAVILGIVIDTVTR